MFSGRQRNGSFVFIIAIVCVGVFLLSTFKKEVSQNRSIASEEQRPYSFGGSCTSQGSWTAAALAQTSVIRDAVRALKDDPNCKGIESLADKLTTAESTFAAPKDASASDMATWEGLPGDIQSLKQLGQFDGGNKNVLSILMGKTIDNVAMSKNISSLAMRSSRTLNTGLNLLDQTLEILPQYEQCIFNHPDQGVAMFGATLKLASAFIGSGETLANRMGTSVSKLVTFMQQKKFATILKKLNQTEFWMSMSCLVETTTEAYCAVRDSYEMLAYSEKEEALLNDLKKNSDGNPLEGYYLLVRELPVITQWIQKVQFGATPRILSDTITKNSTIDSYAEFQKKENQLLAIYSQNLDILNDSKSIEAKRVSVYNMLMQLTMMISETERANQNFFTMAKLGNFIPFYLIGRDRVPEECTGRMPRDPAEYLQNGGMAAEQSDPDALALKIGENLRKLITEASDIAGTYFQRRMIVDKGNLVDDSLTGQTLTVFQSLENVSRYLSKLIDRSKKNQRNLIQLPNMLDTKKRIDDVLASYASVRTKVKTYLEMQKDVTSPEDKIIFDEKILADEELKNAYSNIIDKAFKNFNVLMQKDTFLISRLTTYVKKDYATRIQDSADISKDQRDILIVAGKNLIDRITSVHQINPVDVANDLSTAQVINKRNLDAVEQLFADTLTGVIAEIKTVADGKENTKEAVTKDSASRLFNKIFRITPTEVKKIPSATFWSYVIFSRAIKNIKDFYYHRESYPTYFLPSEETNSDEDSFKSFAKFKSRLCIQALAFKNQDRLYDICKGSSLAPLMATATSTSALSAFYDNPAKIGLTGLKSSFTPDAYRAQRDQNICAFRNYRRSNYAYWLLKNFSRDLNIAAHD